MTSKPTPISEQRRTGLCLPGRGAASCSFLSFGLDGWGCLKGSNLESHIAARRATKSMGAMGDNCPGPPFTTEGETQTEPVTT